MRRIKGSAIYNYFGLGGGDSFGHPDRDFTCRYYFNHWESAFGGSSFSNWPVAETAFYLPFVVPVATYVDALSYTTGNTASGNVDLGIYKPDGTLIVSTGSTAMSGTGGSLHTISISETLLVPGLYYIGMVIDNTTADVNSFDFGDADANTFCLMKTEASAFPLPATATFANITTNSIDMGIPFARISRYA